MGAAPAEILRFPSEVSVDHLSTPSESEELSPRSRRFTRIRSLPAPSAEEIEQGLGLLDPQTAFSEGTPGKVVTRRGGGLSLLQRRKSLPGKLVLETSRTSSGSLAEDSSFLAELEQEFILHETLGTGSTGFVQRAQRRSDGLQVALKRLTGLGEAQTAQMAQAEFNILRRLSHPSVVGAHELKVRGASAALVLELFVGRTLQEVVTQAAGGCFDEGLVCPFTRELLQGLDHIHQRGMSHRDIKPQNIMVSLDLRSAKIIDFNCAADQCDTADSLSPVRGTRMYAAPETLYGAQPSALSDVWSAGLCVHFALSGRLPQKRDRCSTVDCLSILARAEVGFSGKPWSATSQECRDFLRRCLAIDVERRSNASDLLQEPWLLQQGVLGPDDTPCPPQHTAIAGA